MGMRSRECLAAGLGKYSAMGPIPVRGISLGGVLLVKRGCKVKIGWDGSVMVFLKGD